MSCTWYNDVIYVLFQPNDPSLDCHVLYLNGVIPVLFRPNGPSLDRHVLYLNGVIPVLIQPNDPSLDRHVLYLNGVIPVLIQPNDPSLDRHVLYLNGVIPVLFRPNGPPLDCHVLYLNDVITRVLYSLADAVNKIEFEPHRATYSPGETIKCSANGNPPPTVTWDNEAEVVETGEGYQVITVPESTENGKPMTFSCTAQNNIGHQQHIHSGVITFQVPGELSGGLAERNGEWVFLAWRCKMPRFW